jgi:hypothetical protein
MGDVKKRAIRHKKPEWAKRLPPQVLSNLIRVHGIDNATLDKSDYSNRLYHEEFAIGIQQQEVEK